MKETYFVKATFERDLLEIKTKQEHTISVLLSWRRRRWQKLDDVVKMSHVSGINLELIAMHVLLVYRPAEKSSST